jgi:hypothetical protein
MAVSSSSFKLDAIANCLNQLFNLKKILDPLEGDKEYQDIEI